MKKFTLFLIIIFTTNTSFSQDTIYCNEDECGGLDPSWQLVGTVTEACEGETFFLRSAESTPLSNIDSYTWTLLTLELVPEIIFQETYADTTWFSYSYNAPEEPECDGSGKIDLEVILTITSPPCTAPNGDLIESCRYSAEPLSIQLKPIARFSHSDPKCAGEPIQFTDESCYAETYLWDFGNGDTSTEQNPSFTYNTPGTYSVSLTATNECGSDTETQIINVLGIPETSLLLIDGGVGCAPDRQQVTFTPNQWISYHYWEIEPNVSEGWCFNENLSGVGDTIICQPDPQYLYLYGQDTLDMAIFSSGEYEVTLFYGNDCVDEEVTEIIDIYAPPTISSLNNFSGCDEVTVCFNELGLTLGGDITQYNWTFTGTTGGDYSNDINPDFGCRIFNQSGTISLELEGISPCPNATRTANINVITTGTVNVNDISTPICQNDAPLSINPSQPNGRYFDGMTEVFFITNDMLDPSALSPGDYTLNYIIGFGTACPAEDDFSFSILQGPFVELGTYGNFCQTAINFDPTAGMTFGGDIDSWSWQICDASGNVVEMSNSPNPTFNINTPGEYAVKVSVSSTECGIVSDTSPLFVQADDPATITPVGTTLCQSSAPIMLEVAPFGGMWSGTGIDADGTFDPSNLNAGMYPITYSIDGGACSSSDMITFNVLANPFIELDEYDSYCQTASNFDPTSDMISAGDIDNWNWEICDADGNVLEMSNAPNPTFNINTPGEYSVKVSVSSTECGTVSDTSSLFIQADDPAVITPVNTPFCQGSSPAMLEAVPPGGIWSGAGVAPDGTFNPSVLNPGMYPITYSIESGACSSSDVITLEVVASAVVMAVDTFFCITDMPAMLEVFPAGGTFSGDAGIVTDDGIFSPQIAGVGTSTVMYNYVDDNDCEINIEIDVEVDEIPMIAVSDTIFICIDPNDVDLFDEVNTFGVEGTLTFAGMGINQDGIFNGNGLNAGFYNIDVTFTTRSCVVDATFTIELGEKPELVMPTDTTVCVDGGNLILSANVDGGLWSSNDCPINPNTGEIDVENIGEAACTFIYTLSEGTSCEQSGEVTVEILDLNDDIEVPPHADVCFADATYTFPNFSPFGGTWTGEGVIDATNGIVDIFQLESGQEYEYQYCIESQIVAECEACKTTTLYIAPLPVADFATSEPPCQNQQFTLINNSEGAIAYQWNFGDGNTSQLPEPTHTYTTEGDFNLQLIAITNYGCRDTLVQEIHVTPPPTLDLQILTDEGCAPLNVEYINNSSGEGIEQYWIIGGIDTLFEAQPEIILDGVLTDSLITVEFWVVNGCAALSDSQEVLVHPYPVVDFGVEHLVGCSPDTLAFMNISQGLPETLMWDFDNGNTSTSFQPENQVYTSPDDSVSTYYPTLIATNMCGSDTLTKPITINPNNVDAFFEADILSGCPPLTVCVSNYSTLGATIIYNFGDGGTSITPDTCYIYQTPGKYVITQSAELCGIDFFKSDTIEVFPLPVLEADFPQMVCVGDTVYFENNSIGSAALWNFGDGNTSDNLNPVHIYQNSGTYAVELVMYSDFYACPDTLTRNITVREQLAATPIATPNTACPGDLIQFNVGNSAENYAWDFGDGQGATEATTNHSYSESGTYEVNLTVFDEFDCPNDSTIFIVIHEAPESEFELNTNEICQFYDTIIAVNQSIDYITSEWYLNGAFYSNQNDSLAFAPASAGMYEVMLISENAFGCRDTFSRNFDVLASPVAGIMASPTEGCEPLVVNFTDNSQNNEWTFWTFDTNNPDNTSTEANPSFTYESGSYTVLLIVGSTNGCPDDTDTINITVHPASIADFVVNMPDSCGIPSTITLENVSENSENFTWDFGDGNTSNAFAPTHIYTSAGTYTIELTTNNIHNCPDTARATINAFPQPTAGFNIPTNQVCEGDTLPITDLSMDATSVIWLVDGEAQTGADIVLTEAGTYSISQIATYEESCFDTTSFTQIVSVYNAPIADFSYISDSDPIILGDVQFTNESTDADSYLWNFGDNTPTSTEVNPYHEFRTNPPSEVVLIAANYNNGAFTCVDSTSQLVDYEKIQTFYAPNALSPDQSFGNELVAVFKPVGLGIASYKLEIFSPWGDMIATLSEVENGSPTDEWDGTYKGKTVPQGAYLWTARIDYVSGHYEFQRGILTVVR